MSDLISRQAVLNLLHALPPEEAMTKAMLIQSVKQMDVAQPEKRTEERTEKHACDCISRQAAIDEIVAWTVEDRPDIEMPTDLVGRINALPSAQPEPIRLHVDHAFTEEEIKNLKQKISDSPIVFIPSAEKPFKLPEIYVADGYDTVADEDGNVGFGVYVPDENQIYVAGDVEDEIRAKALLHELCHWVQAMCGRSFDEDEANEFSDIVYDALPSAQPDKEKISDALYYIYRNKGTSTSAEGVAAIKYYIAEIWRELYGEEGPGWLKK